MRKMLIRHAAAFGITGIEYEGCSFITFKMSRGSDGELISSMADEVRTHGIDAEALVAGGDVPVFEKYDDYVPSDLLRRAYAIDKLNVDEVANRLLEIEREYETEGEEG